MNNVTLMGRLTRDPETRMSQSGTQVTKYTLAVDRVGEGADFIPCVVFGKGAEFAEKYLTKGVKIGVVGRIQTGSYMAKDGHKVYTTEIAVDKQEFAESRKEQTDGFAEIPDNIDLEVPFN